MQVDESGYAFDPADASCGGFPRLKVQTLKGTCLGIVFHHGNSKDSAGKLKFKMPRTIVQVPGADQFLLTDMGGWHPNIGSLLWIKRQGSRYTLQVIWPRLDLPHGLAFNERDGFFYLGENNRITRFHSDSARGEPDDVAYIDPRPEGRIKIGNTNWRKVYVLPGHTRLVPGACDAPLDGVFYSAL